VGWLGSSTFQDIRRDWTVGGVSVLGGDADVGAKVRRCGDTFHPPEKWTLYLKVTPFDSKTPTHFRTKVPIGGYLRRCQTP